MIVTFPFFVQDLFRIVVIRKSDETSMQLRQFRYLIAVAEHGNFTRAAEALHVSQPALSQQILQMEERLGAALFDRSGRTIVLTDLGHAYLAHVRRALHELECGHRAMDDVRDLSKGLVRLALTPTFMAYIAAPLVTQFHARFPGIRVALREMSMDTVAAAVLADEVDLGIAFSLERSTEIECIPLFLEKLCLVVASSHPCAEAGSVRAAEVARMELALLTPDFVTRTYVDHYFEDQSLLPSISIEANTINTLVQIVKHSQMATILPDAICARIPGVRNLLLDPAPVPRTAMLLRRREQYLSIAARAFMDTILQSSGQWGQSLDGL